MSEQLNDYEPLPPRRRKKGKKKWLYVGLAALLAIVLLLIYYVYSILDFARNIHEPARPQTEDGNPTEEQVPVWEGTERVNILLLGGDSRGLKSNEKARSDTMIVASVDPVTKKAHLLSILRDTYIEIPGHRRDRINAAITMGGPELAMEAVSRLTGLQIQYYVYTDFQGFIALIDKMGGIEFEVEKRMKYTDSADDPQFNIDLQPGLQHMDGKTALQYVRFRHDRLSDYARAERQRKFLSAVATKLKSTTSMLRLPALLKSIEPYIQTNIGLDDMIKLARLGLEVDTSNIVGLQIPPTELLREETIGGASVITVTNQEKLREYVQQQLSPPEEEEDSPGDANKPGSSDAPGNSGDSGEPGNSDAASHPGISGNSNTSS